MDSNAHFKALEVDFFFDIVDDLDHVEAHFNNILGFFGRISIVVVDYP